jgi:hypothetical protein
MVVTPFFVTRLAADDKGGSASTKAHLAVSLYRLHWVLEPTSSILTRTMPSPSCKISTLSSNRISVYSEDETSHVQLPCPAAEGSETEYGEVNVVGASLYRRDIPLNRRQKDDWAHVLKSSGLTARAVDAAASAHRMALRMLTDMSSDSQ